MKRLLKNPWWVVVGSALALTVSQGPILGFTFSVFLKPVTETFGWDRSTFSNVAASLQPARDAQLSPQGSTRLTAVSNVTAPAPTRCSSRSAPDPVLMMKLATTIEAGGILSPAGLANEAALATTPAGSGLYKLTGATTSWAVYVRNDTYWDTRRTWSKVAPRNLEIITYADTNERLNAMQTGQIDAMIIDPVQQLRRRASASRRRSRDRDAAGRRGDW